MRAVMWTDVFQVVVMVAGIVAVLVKGSVAVGGLSNVFEIAREGGRMHMFKYFKSFPYYIQVCVS